jgi:predicted metal-binding membrane protein
MRWTVFGIAIFRNDREMTARDARPPAAVMIPRRDRILITGCILSICVLAWAYLVHLERGMSSLRAPAAPAMMPGMPMPMDAPWGAADFAFTFTMWSVMMVGMMGTTAMPVLLVFGAAHARRAERGIPSVALLFGLGYLTVWLGFSACATLVQWALHQAALLSSAMRVTSPRLDGALLVAAGAYQLTPLKSACLEHCQTPMGFLMSHWRDGPGGAFRMGLRHGIYCLGCCWALMAVLFAVGIMNLAWVAVLTVFILVERIGRTGARVARIGGVVMVALGALVVAGWWR